MKKWIVIAASLLISLTLNHQAVASDIDNLLALPEKKIDIGIAALTFAKEVYPNLDIKTYSAKIDKMVKEAKAFTGKSNNPEYKKLALNTYLFRDYKLEYDLTDPYATKPENRYINGILETKKGSCITMPMLYMAIAQRMGYPVYPVVTPDHYFLRYVDPKLKKQNIEATSNGGYSPDDVLIKELEISELGIKSGAYLRTMTYREYLAELLSLNGVYWAEHGDLVRGINYLDKATDINPKAANSFETLAIIYYRYSKLNKDPLSRELNLMDAEWMHDIAMRLGFVKVNHEEYEEYVKKKLLAKNARKRKEPNK